MDNAPILDATTILVVDDDKLMRQHMRRVMEQAGYQVVEAQNGEQAIAAYTQFRPSLVLLDAVMPVMDGFACCRHLRSFPNGDSVPILIVTRLDDAESLQLAFDAGATDFITKPINDIVLRQRVRHLLQASRTMAELRASTDAAQASRQQVTNILESISDGFFALDNEWRFTYINQHAQVFLQKTRSELIGKNIWDEFPEAVGSTFDQEYRQVRAQQIAVAFEEFYPPLNTWFAVHAYPSQDGISVYFQNINERKRLEAIARTRERELADFLENASVGIHWVGADGIVVWANQAELNLLGYTREEYIGQHIAKFHADREVIDDILQRLNAGETLCDYEARLLCKDGSIRDVSIGSNVFWKDKQFIHTRCFTRDITDRKRAEAELQRQNLRSQLFAEITLKIRQSLQLESILQTTVNEIQKFLRADRVIIFRLWLDGSGNVVREAVVNDHPAIFGQHIYDPCFREEYIQKYRQGRISAIHDIEQAEIHACHKELLQQYGVKANLVVPIFLKRELWGLLIAHQCSSPRVWSSFETELLRQLSDQIGIALAQAQMLAEETRYAQELARSNAELQQFASVASHDLQEPLRKIQAFGNRLKASCGDVLNEQGLDSLERMQNAAGRMQTLIDDLLMLSRVTTKAQPFVTVDLNRVVKEVLSDLEVRIQQTGGKVEVSSLPKIDADPVQMQQLLQNLLSNALKFHKQDTPPVVKLFSQLFDSQHQPVTDGAIATSCQIMVEDNGIGFEQKYLDRIFNVFQRLHSRSQYEGTGIGLAICRKIVERHQGSITAQSSPGQGAKFTIALPMKQLVGDNSE
ncbi:response regulator [Chroococcidiopsis sp. FACHB-1243]|uniref:response regulator n=1 Tax=Chroococcidiopsis sp. [FACHB-1243] TaxID=2692781 RepID=UPI001784F882|nr:response regulator [Chroococcidiopsis sp. [FACHB-1243]]MBD2306069.1 response regulator [Chroococcidiopsis sp. [FACHB-1243]]